MRVDLKKRSPWQVLVTALLRGVQNIFGAESEVVLLFLQVQ